MDVSVIVTVLNEGPAVDKLLGSLAQQSRPPDEVVVVDGGSTDDTLARLEAWSARDRLPMTVLRAPGANISEGRNLAIAAAAGPAIASIDAGVRAEPNWLERLTAPLSDDQPFVAGFFEPDPTSTFEWALGAVTLPRAHEIDPERFLPSSRSVAFLKSAWRAAGGYPEWLDYCEDLIFDFRVADEVGRPAFAPDAVVRFRPRTGLQAFFRQYFLYARGDGKAGLWPRRHLIRYATYLVGGPGLLWAGLRTPWALGVLGAGFAAMLWRPVQRLTSDWQGRSASERFLGLLWLPVIRVTGDVAKMFGYPVGLLWRLRRSRSADR